MRYTEVMRKLFIGTVCFCFITAQCFAQKKNSLAGTWHVQLDKENIGIRQQWYKRHFEQPIQMPGTLDGAGIGDRPTVDTNVIERNILLTLARKHSYIGAAWYSKEISISQSWKNKHIEIFLERVIWNTKIWIDGEEAGSQESLSTPHQFVVSKLLMPGKHLLVIRIDNSRQYDISHRGMAHAYTDHTQGVWNGMIGKLQLIAKDDILINELQVYPQVKTKSIIVFASMAGSQTQTAQLNVQVSDKNKKIIAVKKISVQIGPEASKQNIEIALGVSALLWDEFSPNLYSVKAELVAGKQKDTRSVVFGLRELTNENSLLQINGRRLFLRGTLECAIFPLTGHPPMDKQGWSKVFSSAKAYGLNHLRFHSWCPPEAAFEMADSLGFYLQVELPFWSEKLNADTLDAKSKRFVEQEAQRISKEFGNHPSFCLWSMGNEIRGDFDWLHEMVKQLKAKDPRHLYASTTFTFQKDHGKWPEPVDDFFVTQYTAKGWVRGQGIFNTIAPDFSTDYSIAIDSIHVPVITHEIGQYAVYPNPEEIKKYTGVFDPLNFKAIREDLRKKNLLHLALDFTKASGELSAALYKEEIERALKTKGLSGFQLLDLHDFPGQGTALVGMLDAFWDSKGLVSGEEHRMYCSEVVPLLRYKKATYTNAEKFEAVAEIANFSKGIIKNAMPEWTVADEKGNVVFKGRLHGSDIALGNGYELGKIEFDLNSISKATCLTIQLQLKGSSYKNAWKIWVYPETLPSAGSNVVFTTSYTEAIQNLELGKTVLFNPDTIGVNGVEGRYAPVFWSPVHFPKQPGTMGILCDPAHPAFANFPTGFHTDWQWWDLITSSKTMIIDSISNLEPIVRVVDNFVKNRKMANMIEARFAKGRLLMTSLDITHNLDKRPAARQLRYSLEQYLSGNSFSPKDELSKEQLELLLKNTY
jgi:hypothetical protein